MDKKRVLIIGATGMLGHMTYHYLKTLDKFVLLNSVYRNKLTEDSILCDVTDEKSLKDLVQKTRPNIVINCIGALVNQSKENRESAIYLNALLPHKLKVMCDKNQAKLIHISTDCVFSGEKGNYSEDDFRDADDIYGRSKALGEIFEPPHCTLRTSIIGPELKTNGTGLYHWFMNQEKAVDGYVNAFWSGVTTFELAKAIFKVINHNLEGLYHVTNGEAISKYDLLHLFNEQRTNKIEIKTFHNYHVNKTLQKSIKFDFEVPSYAVMMKTMNNLFDE